MGYQTEDGIPDNDGVPVRGGVPDTGWVLDRDGVVSDMDGGVPGRDGLTILTSHQSVILHSLIFQVSIDLLWI